ncbi:MAG TPA: SPASM domain-containing protein, partial [Longimicrobium sp.]|nr:SPASM domain-containing protein [Longimicrobium sp.]
YAALLGDAELAPNSCNAPWVSSVLEADGTVRPCFFQPPLGNVREAGSLDAVLNSDGARRWRAGLDVQRDAICRRCVCSLSLRAGSAELAPAAAG